MLEGPLRRGGFRCACCQAPFSVESLSFAPISPIANKILIAGRLTAGGHNGTKQFEAY